MNEEITFNEVEIDKVLDELEEINKKFKSIARYYDSMVQLVNKVKGTQEIGKVANIDISGIDSKDGKYPINRTSLVALYNQVEDAKETIKEYANNDFFKDNSKTFEYHGGKLSTHIENQMIKEVGECCGLTGLAVSEEAKAILKNIQNTRKDISLTAHDDVEEKKQLSKDTGAAVVDLKNEYKTDRKSPETQEDKQHHKTGTSKEEQKITVTQEDNNIINSELTANTKTAPQVSGQVSGTAIESTKEENPVEQEESLKEEALIETKDGPPKTTDVTNTQNQIKEVNQKATFSSQSVKPIITTQEENKQNDDNKVVSLSAGVAGVGVAGVGVKAYNDYKESHKENDSSEDDSLEDDKESQKDNQKEELDD